jgi:hypothetical protein
MKKSPVSGLAGSVRIDRLTLQGITKAENHGKRLDESSKRRVIKDAPAVTTTGLDLYALYEEHIKGAFVPKAECRALHVLVQFPTDLVDGDDASGMLRHARQFAERVFGDRAIFADRIDRDEQGQQVVDLFVAPIYLKKTKRQDKVAVSTTKHLKALAAKYGFEKTTLRNEGRALQTAFFEYLRDEMQLAGVERGEQKWSLDPDWKSREQLREEELEKLKAETENALAEAAEARSLALAEVAQAQALRIEEAEAAYDRRLAQQQSAERMTVALAKMEAENARLNAELQERLAAAKVKEAEAELQAERWRVENQAAERDRAKAAAMVRAATDQSRQLANDRSLHQEQIALLSRSADDKEGLHLQIGRHPVSDAGFVMDEQHMSAMERNAYRKPWPPAIAAMARALARALATIRNAAAKVFERERAIANRETLMATEQAEANRSLEERRAAQMHEHRLAVKTLEERQAAVDAAHADAVGSRADAEARIEIATIREKTASAAAAFNARWGRALAAIANTPNVITIDEDGVASFDKQIAKTLGEEFAETIASRPPEWADEGLTRELEIAEQRHVLAERDRQASKQVQQLAALLEKAGSVLTPPQQLVAEEVRHAVGTTAAALSNRQDRGM